MRKIATIVLVLSLLILTACQATAKSTSVIYEVTGSARRVDITLSNSTGGTEQYSHVATPWSIKYPDFQSNFLYISAQNSGETGSVIVNIKVNDQFYKTSTSTGAYVIATASGTKP